MVVVVVVVVAGGDCSPVLQAALTALPDCKLFIVLESWHRSSSLLLAPDNRMPSEW